MPDEIPNNAPLPPYQTNTKVLIIAAVTMVALAFPLAGMAFALKGYLAARNASPAPTAEVAGTFNAAPLTAALESVATKKLGGDQEVLGANEKIVRQFSSGEIPSQAQRLESLARQVGGSALELTAPTESSRRWMVQVPSGRKDVLARAIAEDSTTVMTVSAGEGTQILEVILEKKP